MSLNSRLRSLVTRSAQSDSPVLECAVTPHTDSTLYDADTCLENGSDHGWAEARNRWEKVVENRPDDVNANIQLMHIHRELGNTEQADTILLKLGELGVVTRSVRIQIARYYMKEKLNDVAIERWRDIERLYPEQNEATNNLAHLYLRVGNIDLALAATDRLEQIYKQADRALRLRIKCFVESEDWPKAILVLEEKLTSDPSDIDVRVQLCNCLLKLDRVGHALKIIESTDESASSTKVIRALKHRLYMRERNWKKAIVENTKLLKIEASNMNLLSDRAMILYQMGSYAEAEVACQRFLESYPDDLRVLTLYARVGQAQAASPRQEEVHY